jgi:hypothetical protein
MPAYIGFFTQLKIPVLSVMQFTPTKTGKKISKMGYVTPADIHNTMKVDRDRRNSYVGSYDGYRHHLNMHDPNKSEPTSNIQGMNTYRAPVDANEWDLYLKPGTTFDKAVKTVLDRKEGWKIDFVGHKNDWKSLKRIEIKRGEGFMSITLWSCTGSAKLFT